MRRAVTILAALFLTTCGPGTALEPRPSVLLVTLGAVRADRLGPYGHEAADTPVLQRLADDAVLFRRAYAAAPLTQPSHATLLTGLLPPSHGVRVNGAHLLDEGVVTLAERFQDEGWHTVAVTGSLATLGRWGLSQGFQIYDDDPAQVVRPADQVVDRALSLFHAAPGPLFAWVHLADAHASPEPPVPTRDPYDGALASLDAQLGRLLAGWEARHPDSVVLLTSDHGEGLGDGGEQGHGLLLHDPTLRVPLILRAPDLPPGEVVDPVGHSDIAPTLLALAGLPVPPELQGRDLRRGGSELVYSETLAGQGLFGLAGLYAFTRTDGRYVEGSFGAWYRADEDQVLLTPAPPVEQGGPDLQAHGELLARLRRGSAETLAPEVALDPELLALLSALGMFGGDPEVGGGAVDPRDAVELGARVRRFRWLAELGLYGPAEELVEGLELRMPETFGVALLRTHLLTHRGALEAAAERWGELFHPSPRATIALQQAGLAVTLGRWDDAEAAYRDALVLQPSSAHALAGLGRSLHAQGRRAEAEALDRVAVSPDAPELALLRAELLLDDGLATAAFDEARAGLAALPWSSWAHTLAGRALWELGRPHEAVAHLEDALRLAPYDATVRALLARWKLELGAHREAVRLIAPVARKLPHDDDVVGLYAEARRALYAGAR